MATGATFQNIFFPFNNPSVISGCQLWLDAADATTITGTSSVTQWRDKSGNTRHMGVGSGTTSYSSSAIQLTNSYMFVTSAVNLTNVTVFIIAKTTGPHNQTVFIGRPNTNVDYNSLDGFGFYMDSTSGIRFYGQFPSGNSQFSVNTSTPRLFSFKSTGTSVSGWYEGVSQSGATLSSTRTSTAQGFAIGAHWQGGSYGNIIANASLYEIIVYNSDVTDNQRQQIEGYLAWKWGLQGNLPSDHPYKTAAPQVLPTINSAQVGTIPLTIQKNRSFVPTQISGCSLWLDGADPAGNGVIPANGTSITSWVDKSLSGNTCSNASSINSPVLYSSILNGKPVLSFTGPAVLNTTTSQWLDNTVMTFPNTKNTIFALVYNDNSTSKSFTANNYIISGRADALISYSSYSGNNFATFIGSGSGWNDLNTNTPSQNMNGVWAITGMTLNTNVLTPYYNGTALNTKSGTMGSTTGFIIGDAPSGYRGQCWNGYMAEIIMFPTVLGNTQRQQVEGYLAWKWGLQGNLPAGHPYKNINNNYNPFPSTTPALTRSISSIFKPTNYAGCQLWLDAWDPLGNGSRQKSPLTLTSWVDKSSSARHATMFNGTNISYSPTAFNNRPALLFTQTQNMSSAAAAGTFPTAITFFMVYQRTGGGTYDTLVTRTVGNLAAPIDFFTNISTGNFSRNIGNGTAQADYNTTSGSNFTNVTTPSLYYANATAASGLLDAFNFATPTDPSSGILTGVYYGDTGTAIYIGTRADSVTKLTASVAEVIVYSTTPSDPQRQNIEGYLAWKWGLQLPASHPYKNYPPPPQ